MTQNHDSEAAGFVDAGALSAIVPGIPELYRQDLLSSTLLGQLAADKLFSRLTQSEQWYNRYFDTLGNLGWGFDHFSFKAFRPKSLTFTVEEVVLGLLEKKITVSEVALVEATMSSLRDLPDDDPRVIVFNERSHSLNDVNVQIIIQTSSVMWSAGIVFTTSQEVKRIFHEKLWTAQLGGDIQCRAQAATLNEAVYSQVRKSVNEKLGSKRNELILRLDIAPR